MGKFCGFIFKPSCENRLQISSFLASSLSASARVRLAQPTHASPAAHRRRRKRIGSGQQVRILFRMQLRARPRLGEDPPPKKKDLAKTKPMHAFSHFPFLSSLSLSLSLHSKPRPASKRDSRHETKQETLRDGLNNVRERGRARREN